MALYLGSKKGKANVLRVDRYSEGYGAGYDDAMMGLSSIKAFVSGKVISVNDVVDSVHELEISLTSDTIADFSNVEVSRYGKNLCSDDYTDYSIIQYAYSYRYIGNTQLRISFTDKDTSVDVSDCYVGFAVNPNVWSEGGRWAVSKGVIQSTLTNVPTAGKTDFYSHIVFSPNTEDAFNRIMQRWDIQVELGGVATEYEPYTKSITRQSTADGIVEGITSISPNMTLLTNNENAIINLKYFRNTNIALENQILDIAMSGGE